MEEIFFRPNSSLQNSELLEYTICKPTLLFKIQHFQNIPTYERKLFPSKFNIIRIYQNITANSSLQYSTLLEYTDIWEPNRTWREFTYVLLFKLRNVFFIQDGTRVVSESSNNAGGYRTYSRSRHVSVERVSSDTTLATLYIPRVSTNDAGLYTCAPDSLPTDTVTLHVVNGK